MEYVRTQPIAQVTSPRRSIVYGQYQLIRNSVDVRQDNGSHTGIIRGKRMAVFCMDDGYLAFIPDRPMTMSKM